MQYDAFNKSLVCNVFLNDAVPYFTHTGTPPKNPKTHFWPSVVP